jgi:predicted glycosyltransferase
LAVSHNSYTQILAARLLGLKSVTLMDYEHQPANHLAFRFASRIIVPSAFPEDALIRHGADLTKVRRYNGAKEDVYLADFERDPRFGAKLRELGVDEDDVLVTVRPPARDALYHRFENELFDELLKRLPERSGVKIILLPRTASQRDQYRSAIKEVSTGSSSDRVIIPPQTLDGPNLIAASDLVISAGGTMNREAAALGVPAATIYAGQWAAIDEKLVREGKLKRIRTQEDLNELPIQKKSNVQVNRATHVRREVAELILAG